MKFGKQVIAFGGLVFLGSGLAPGGEAFAFGQQWRPEPGFSAPQGRIYRQVAKVPAFRPSMPPVPQGYRPAEPATAQLAWQRGPRSYPGNYAQPFSIPVAYPGQRQPFYPPAMAAVPGWPQPFAHMAPPWQQVPMFARQFAWRPASQPWVAVPDSYRQPPRYPVRMAPQFASFRPTAPAYAPAPGSWRPAIQTRSAVSARYAYQTRGYTAQRQPAFAAAGPAAVWNPRAGYWRPEVAQRGSMWQANAAFRPVAYGRSEPRDERLAVRGEPGFGFTQDKLPGWVTTYQDTKFSGSCDWCGGS